MNKKNLAFAGTAVIALVLVLGTVSLRSFKQIATSTTKTSNNISLPKNSVMANHILFERIEDVEREADLIVIGKTTTDIEENQPVVTTTLPDGGIGTFYTITPFEVKKVLKGAIASHSITVRQAAAIVNENGTRSLWIFEDYSLLKKNSLYLLFLSKMDQGGYGVISLNQGKFSLDKTDREELAIEKEDQQYSNLKMQALRKYQHKLY